MKEFFQTQANVIIAGHSGQQHAWMLATVLPLAQYRADFCSKDLHTPTHFCVSVNKDSLCCHIFFCYFWPMRSLRKKMLVSFYYSGYIWIPYAPHVYQWFSNLSVHYKSPGGPVKTQTPGPFFWRFWFGDWDLGTPLGVQLRYSVWWMLHF